MPYGDPDPTDPNVLVGVGLPADRSAVREMALAFAEEFAAMGFDEQRLLLMFDNPFYAAAHQARRVLGEGEVKRIVRESLQAWGGCRVVVLDAPDGPGVVEQESHGIRSPLHPGSPRRSPVTCTIHAPPTLLAIRALRRPRRLNGLLTHQTGGNEQD